MGHPSSLQATRLVYIFVPLVPKRDASVNRDNNRTYLIELWKKNQYYKNIISHQIDLQTVILIKIPASFCFGGNLQGNSKIYVKNQRAKIITKKNKVRWFSLLEIRSYYKAREIKGACFDTRKINRPLKQHWMLRSKSTHVWTPDS